MNILVTGAAGFVGKHLIKELTNNGHFVTAVINNNEEAPVSINSVHADLCNPKEVLNINFREIDGVIHLAGLAAVGISFDEPLKYLTVNASIEVNLYEACLAQDIRPKMLIISSGMLYDPKCEMPLTEESKLSPSSPYGVSKVTQEVFVKYYEKRGFNSIIARPFNHIGPGQNLGFIVPDFAQQITMAEKNGSNIYVGNLESKRDYTDVRDIVRAYRLLMELDAYENNIFNVCSGNCISGQEILDKLLGLASTKINVVIDKEKFRPADIPVIYGNNTKLKNATGWKPKFTLDETINDVLHDWRSRT